MSNTKADEILIRLKELGSESIKKVLVKHGAKEPFYGVKVEELKKIQKKIKKDYQLSMDLFASGISDAMYLAGLIADEKKMSKQDLHLWANHAYWYMLSEYPVAWVAAESSYGFDLALEWIDSPQVNVATAGWATLSLLVGTREDSALDMTLLKKLLDRVTINIHKEKNRVRYTMNGFVIAVGGYVQPLYEKALMVARKIGVVHVDVGETACKVPDALAYISKMVANGSHGKKRKSVRC